MPSPVWASFAGQVREHGSHVARLAALTGLDGRSDCRYRHRHSRFRATTTASAFTAHLNHALDFGRIQRVDCVRAPDRRANERIWAVMGNEMAGKIAVVTGGAAGLGAGI